METWGGAAGVGPVRAALAASAAAGCGGSEETTSSVSHARFAGAAVEPAKPAPPLRLRHSLGRKVDVRKLQGKAVLVTFVYTHCPDVCPLIVSHLHTALAELGPKAKKLRYIVVSTDPRRDTPAAVASFLQDHQMTGRMQSWSGTAPRSAAPGGTGE